MKTVFDMNAEQITIVHATFKITNIINNLKNVNLNEYGIKEVIADLQKTLVVLGRS